MPELPQEVFNEILVHLRNEWAAHPTTLSNIGLQLALTCKSLHRDLCPEIEARQKAIVAKALNTLTPGVGHSYLVTLYGNLGQGLQCITSSGFSSFNEEEINTNDSIGIRRIYLNLPVLRNLDTDLIWSVRTLVAKLPKKARPLLTSFQLCLEWVDEVTEADECRRAAWVHAFVSLLDVVAVQPGCFVYVSYRNGSSTVEDGDGDEDLQNLVKRESASGDGEELDKPVSRPLLSRLKGIIGRTRRPPGPTSVMLAGSLSNPFFHAYAGRIVHPASSFKSLILSGCTGATNAWNSTLTSWTLPRLTSVTLTSVNVPLGTLITFLKRHPTVDYLDARDWNHLQGVSAASNPAAAPTSLHFRVLVADPAFLKELFRSKVRLPALRWFTISCRDNSSFDGTNPDHWADLTLVLTLLGQNQKALKVTSPLRLALNLPHCRRLVSWLETVHQRPPDEEKKQRSLLQRSTEVVESLGKRFRPSPQSQLNLPSTITLTESTGDGLVDEPPLLSSSLQNLRCVTSFRMYAAPVTNNTSDGVDAATVLAFISALPYVRRAAVAAKFAKSGASTWGERELWEDVAGIWSTARRLEMLGLSDAGVSSSLRVTWRRRWKQPRVEVPL